MFEVTYHHRWKWFELLPFMVIGVIGGLIGAFFIKLKLRFDRMRKASFIGRYPVAEQNPNRFPPLSACVPPENTDGDGRC